MWTGTKKFDRTQNALPLKALVTNFAKDEDGALTIFGLYILVVMVMISGLATDIMRHDTIKSELQATADRAALAAADLDQTLDSASVVVDYFEKAKLDKYLKQPVFVDGGLNWRLVTVEANVNMNTYFMSWSGIDNLPINVSSTATERVTDIEISLVLDVSGSMGGTKLTNLKTAAGSFFDAVITNTTDPNEGITSVSVIPYNQAVNVGPTVLDQYTVTNHHNDSHCIHFQPSDFNSRGISTDTELDRMAHFTWRSSDYGQIDDDDYECRPDSQRHIMPFSNNIGELKAMVNALSAGGNTATDVGMKWGAALLDPLAQPVVTALTKQAHPLSTTENPRKMVDPLLDGRPVSYDDKENMKVIVLMTDGKNTDQYDLKSEFKSGPSGVWYSPSGDEYVVYVPTNSSSKRWFYPEKYTYYNWRGKKRTKDHWSDKPSDAVELSYTELYADWETDDVANFFFKNSGSSTLYNTHLQSNVRETITSNSWDGIADSNLLKICDAVKEETVSVFTIAFQAPSSAETMMRNCASSDGHFFDVDDADINSAFRSIASQINRLRLTQ